MERDIHEIVCKELECICDRCITGDVTPVVFDILKKTEDLQALCEHLGIVPKRRIQRHTESISMFDQLFNSGIKLE